MGRLSDKGKEGTWIEGRESKEHEHSDGTRGRDVEAHKVVYKERKFIAKKKKVGGNFTNK
jgi:hypothetical protein